MASVKEMVAVDADSVNGIILTQTEKNQRKAIISSINEKGFSQVMEEVAIHGSTVSARCGSWRLTVTFLPMCASLPMNRITSSRRFYRGNPS